ncbi:MAG: M48 family metallopeptidase [Candidatus Aenigmarchaeota archaeon]|nr:M48 family metallopeptidase [Candidatus Aenigmarchaeota archaeon]
MEIEYVIVRKSGRRGVSISVGPSGVRVSAPAGFPESKIDGLVESRRAWIERNMARFAKKMKIMMEPGLYEDKVMFMGRFVPMSVSPARVREKMSFDGSAFTAALRSGYSRRDVERLYIKWLKREAESFMPSRVAIYSRGLGVSPSKISIRNQKSRWGSASKDGNVTFNCNLLKAPAEVIDYVVVHELCHLRVHDHSKSFWSLVESAFPDYKACRKWLRDNGTGIMDSSKIFG